MFVIGNASRAWTSAWGMDVQTSLPPDAAPAGADEVPATLVAPPGAAVVAPPGAAVAADPEHAANATTTMPNTASRRNLMDISPAPSRHWLKWRDRPTCRSQTDRRSIATAEPPFEWVCASVYRPYILARWTIPETSRGPAGSALAGGRVAVVLLDVPDLDQAAQPGFDQRRVTHEPAQFDA